MSQQPEALLDAAEWVLSVLQEYETDAVVIGAVALAAHHYVRFTEDVDLGVNADVETFQKIAEVLQERDDFEVELRKPDTSDPLSGVIDVRGEFGLIQVINFGQTFPAVISDALREATLTVRPESSLRLAPLPHLIALKLYAGGFKSKADIAELLVRNVNANFQEIRELCDSYRLQGLQDILDEIRD